MNWFFLNLFGNGYNAGRAAIPFVAVVVWGMLPCRRRDISRHNLKRLEKILPNACSHWDTVLCYIGDIFSNRCIPHEGR